MINDADPYSVAVGSYFRQRRQLSAQQVLHVNLPPEPILSAAGFETLRQQIDRHFGDRAPALALAWKQPFAVDCSSITGALALGPDPQLCRNTCAVSRRSPFEGAGAQRAAGGPVRTGAPQGRSASGAGGDERAGTAAGLPGSAGVPSHGAGAASEGDLPFPRLSMLLAAPTVEDARALIDRGVSADGSLARLGAPQAQALMVRTDDAARNRRAVRFVPEGRFRQIPLAVRWIDQEALAGQSRVALVTIGAATVPQLDDVQWVAGGIGDSLTSFGGRISDAGGQTSVLDWIASGATASHGTVSEPCAHLQKFPDPRALLLRYAAGQTALQAYWGSVAWPQQSLFVGEPLSAPFARTEAARGGD